MLFTYEFVNLSMSAKVITFERPKLEVSIQIIE